MKVKEAIHVQLKLHHTQKKKDKEDKHVAAMDILEQ
jgi:hypothetical protein